MLINNEDKMIRRYPGRKSGSVVRFQEKSVSIFADKESYKVSSETTEDANDWGGIDQLLIEADDLMVKPSCEYSTHPDHGLLGIPSEEKKFDSPQAELYYHLFKDDDTRFKWLIPNVVAGGGHPLYYSLQDNLDYLKEEGIRAIVSVFDEPLEPIHLDGLDYHFAPTLDQYTCDLHETCDFISRMEEQNKPVFVHCFAGVGRTGTVLAAYLIYKRYLTVNEAIAYVRDKYNASAIESQYQEESLRRLYPRV